MSTLIPPMKSVRDDMKRRRGITPPRTPFGLTPGGGTQPGTLPARVAGAIGEQARSARADWERRQEGGRPAPVGPEKQKERAESHMAASATAREKAPDAQPVIRAPIRSTNTGAGGPTSEPAPWAEGTPLTEAGEPDVERFGEQGSVTLHGRPGGDPALKRGGFAYAGKVAPRDRLASLPERGETEYGPESPTGGHSWTMTRPGRQRAQYEDARYKREVQARQSGEDAAIADLDARAAESAAAMARSEALEEQPFAPEMLQATQAVTEQRARVQPEMMRSRAAMEAFQTYQDIAGQIDADPNLSPEEKQARRREAEREAWMSIIAAQPSARRPREEFMFGSAPPPEES